MASQKPLTFDRLRCRTAPTAAPSCDGQAPASPGRITDADRRDPGIVGTRAFFDLLAAEPRLRGTAVQTVGVKGWDGFAIAAVSS